MIFVRLNRSISQTTFMIYCGNSVGNDMSE